MGRINLPGSKENKKILLIILIIIAIIVIAKFKIAYHLLLYMKKIA